MIYSAIRSLLFRLDAEAAHDLVTRPMIELQQIPALMELLSRWCVERVDPPVRLWGLEMRNPIGIAAGFDKNGAMIPFLAALGFGFIEVGTVTLHPQPGNPRPRMFRYPRHDALVNRLGFNNDGAEAVALRLTRLWTAVEAGSAAVEHLRGVPVFVNIGKNRDVPVEDAAAVYADAYALLAPQAHGVVINVSSPNTPGLRDLQTPAQLEELIERILEVRSRLSFRLEGEHPVLVKIAPDLDDTQLRGIAEVCVKLVDGIVATNTTTSREGVDEAQDESGGLSGRPLFARSTEILRRLREITGPEYPLVGVGGVFDGRDARAKLDAGANLVQAYTGFVYGGPGFARDIVRGLKRTRNA